MTIRNRADERTLNRLLCSSALAGLGMSLLGTVGVWAAEDDDSKNQIEEIVVTATKRGAQNLQNVPISISAISEQTIRDKRIDNFADFALTVPGLSFQDAGPGDKIITLRGVNSTGTGVATVGMYIDEILVTGDLRQPDLKLFDVKQIEVLRVPQGTLYGSGSLSGTIRIITNKPDPDNFETRADGAVSFTRRGNENYEANLMVNVPLVEGKLALRAVGYVRDMTGFIDNIRLGNKNVNNENTQGGRVTLGFEASENTTISASAFYQGTNLGGRFIFTTADGTNGNFNTDQFVLDPFRDDYKIFNVTMKHNLGWASITASTSYFDRKVSDNFDSTPFDLQFGTFLFTDVLGLSTANGVTNQTDTSELWSNEVRLATQFGGRFESVFGFFYQQVRTTFDTTVETTTDEGIRFQPIEHIFGEFFANKTNKFAIFGEASYALTDKLTALVGLRWFTADQVDNRINTFPFGGFNPPSTEPPLPSSDTKLTPKFYLSYQATDDALLFATISQGFRVGGGNQNPIFPLPPENQQFKSDQLWNFEVGTKTSWYDDRLQLNAGVYYILWNNIQVSDFTDDANSFTFISNAGKARVAGVEVEANARPLPGLNLGATFSFTGAQLTRDQPTVNFGFGGRRGDRFPNVPRWASSATAQYVWPAAATYDGFVRADFAYVGASETQFNPNSPIANHKSAYTTVDFKLGIRGDNWGLELFIDNLFDSLGQVNIIEQASDLTPRAIVPLVPRTVGINLTKGF